MLKSKCGTTLFIRHWRVPRYLKAIIYRHRFALFSLQIGRNASRCDASLTGRLWLCMLRGWLVPIRCFPPHSSEESTYNAGVGVCWKQKTDSVWVSSNFHSPEPTMDQTRDNDKRRLESSLGFFLQSIAYVDSDSSSWAGPLVFCFNLQHTE